MNNSAPVRFSIREITLIGTFSALMAVFSQIVIPMAPVPFSFGMFIAMLTAIVLPTRLAVSVQFVYLLLGAVGLPVFAQFQGGLQRIVGPTGGYLIGYLFMALVMGKLFPLRLGNSFYGAVAITLLGMIVCYACGTVWLAVSTGMGLSAALMAGVVPFVAFDVVKAVAATVLGRRLRKMLPYIE